MRKGNLDVDLNDDDSSYSSGSSIDDGIDEAQQQRVGLTTATPPSQSAMGSIPTDRRAMLTKTLSQAAMAVPEDLCEIPDDVYSMFFLSRIGGPAFWYPVYVTGKQQLYMVPRMHWLVQFKTHLGFKNSPKDGIVHISNDRCR